MNIVKFESKEDRYNKMCDAQQEELEAAGRRIAMKADNGATVTENDILGMFRMLGKHSRERKDFLKK